MEMKIGVFDSGVGGLTVLRELVCRLPHASFLYFGDTARLPYGSKSAETVARYAIEAARFLEAQGMDMLVVGCNTATALALPEIRASVKVPVEGVIEPGAEAAAIATARKRVVVIATEATVDSHAYRRELEQRNINVREKSCPLFVPLIEENWIDHPITQRVAHIYLDDFFYDYETGPDVLVLGCTHYPLIKPILRGVCPWRVEIVDSAEATAKVVARRLGAAQGNAAARPPSITYFATDSAERFRRLGQIFMGHPIETVNLVSIGG
jgi:glutamate racemase